MVLVLGVHLRAHIPQRTACRSVTESCRVVERRRSVVVSGIYARPQFEEQIARANVTKTGREMHWRVSLLIRSVDISLTLFVKSTAASVVALLRAL